MTRTLWRALALGACLVCSAQAEAEVIIGLLSDNRLTSFDSASPGSTSAPVAITGTGGDLIFGIDIRPATGRLYGIGSGGQAGTRLYTIDTGTGVATLASTLSPAANLTGPVGIDFNPVPDRLRLVTTGDSNFRINVDTGVVATDGNLAYAAGDPNAGRNPNVVGSAYSNNIPGAATTTLYGIDSGTGALVIQNPPNNGTLQTVGSLGVTTTEAVGFDISGRTGVAYASLTPVGAGARFYTINLSTGAATLLGDVGAAGTLIDIAAPVGVPEPSTLALACVGACVVGLRVVSRKATARVA